MPYIGSAAAECQSLMHLRVTQEHILCKPHYLSSEPWTFPMRLCLMLLLTLNSSGPCSRHFISLFHVARLQYVPRCALHNQFVIAHTALHSFLQNCFYCTMVQEGTGCRNWMQVAQGLNNGCALVLAYLVEGIYIVLQLVFLQVSVYHVVTSTHAKVAIPQNSVRQVAVHNKRKVFD